MKKIITLTLLFFTFISFSQQINIDKGKFYMRGNQVYNRELKQLLSSNVKAVTLYNQAKSKEAWGGFLLGVGIGLTTADLAIGLFSDKKYPTEMTYIGLGSIAVSVPILSGRKKKIEEAIKIYNSEHSDFGLTNNFELNAISNQNGLGIQISF